MKEEEEIYDNIQKIFEELPENYSILEEQIDLDIQMAYFELSKKVQEEDKSYTLRKLKRDINLPSTTPERKKKLLIQIARIDDVKAFRFLEGYLEEAKGVLRDWTLLAIHESRLLIQTSLLDEKQYFISTGLGGKDKKLRFYMALIYRDREANLTKTQQKVVRNELIMALNREDGEFESIEFSEGFCTMLFLLPVTSDVQELSVRVILESNQYGSFLDEEMIITNVKILTRSEILDIIHQAGDQKDTNR